MRDAGEPTGTRETGRRTEEILLITEYFHPDTASSGRLVTDLAVGLKARGIDVTVYTSQPHYYGSDGGSEPRRSTYRGVTVKRTRAPDVRPTTLVHRLFNWFVFSVWTFVGLLFSPSKPNREVVFLSNPPFQSVFMWLLCTLRGWNYTYIVHDLYPDQPVELGVIRRNGVIDTVWSWLQRRVYENADRIVTNGPMMRRRIVDNAGSAVSTGDVTVIHNWEVHDDITPVDRSTNRFRDHHDLAEKFVILYSGNIGLFHDFETVIDAATRLADRDVVMLLIGDGDAKEDVVAYAKQRGVYGTAVRFLPYQDIDVLPYSLTAGDVNLVSVAPGFEGVNLSLKVYTAMVTATPILAISSPTDDESLIVENYGIGEHVSQGDVDGVVSMVENWLANPGRLEEQGKTAREIYDANFTSEHAIDAYYDLFVVGATEDSFRDIDRPR